MTPPGTGPTAPLPPFVPAPLAAGPHRQTLLARVLRPRSVLTDRRVRLATPDGDFLDVDFGPDPGTHAPVALVVHGLEGNAGRRYVQSACRHLLASGIHPVAMNLRGCSGEANRLPRAYHSGDTPDVAHVLGELRSRYPGRPLGAWGFSLGGNILLKLMGERADGGAGLLDAAVAVSVPYDLAAGCALLERTPMGRLYTRYFLRSLRRKIREKAPLLGDVIDVDGALRASTLRTFDDAATAPLHGFADAGDYYARCSAGPFLPGIRVPTLLLQSRDDPFLPPTALPEGAMDANPCLTAVITEKGGHVGFLTGALVRPRFWAEEEGARFLARLLGSGEQLVSEPEVPS